MIDAKTKLILIDCTTGEYITGTLEKRTVDQHPVCTQKHFVHTICKLFEDVYPNMEENPLYQDINWSEIKNQTYQEAENGEIKS